MQKRDNNSRLTFSKFKNDFMILLKSPARTSEKFENSAVVLLTNSQEFSVNESTRFSIE